MESFNWQKLHESSMNWSHMFKHVFQFINDCEMSRIGFSLQFDILIN